jgi:bacterioferritin-associated ferredoxin
MWICHCNPFNDKDVKSCLDGKKGETARVSDVYKTCSGGNRPKCATCIPHLQDMVMEHNRGATVESLRKVVEAPEKDKAAPAAPAPAPTKAGGV